MELDITDFFTTAAPMDYSASVAEIGRDAGRATWQAALDDSADWPLLDTPEKCQTFRDYCRDFGAWDDDERAAWNETTCNALLIQMIAGDMRECAMSADWTADDWAAYEADENICHNIVRGDDGRVYYDVGT